MIFTLIKSSALIRKFSLSNVVTPPIGLAYLAGALKSKKIDCDVIDGVGLNLDKISKLDYVDGFGVGLTNDEIVDRINPATDIIGISCMFSSSWSHDFNLIQKIKKKFPRLKIIVGGEHATACAEYLISEFTEIDFCIKGEGEESLPALINWIRSHGLNERCDLPGVVSRFNNRPYFSKEAQRIKVIDQIAWPDWDKIPLEEYLKRKISHGTSNKSMPVLASRGCPYRCTFCSSPQMWTPLWKARDINDLLNEMQYYIQKYDVHHFDFFDLTAIVQKKWIINFCQELERRNFKITYQLPSGTRSEAIDGEVAYWLKRTGCTQMNYAPESGSTETLIRIKKKMQLSRLEKSIKEVLKQDIKVMCNIILFPHDTVRDLALTFLFMIKASFWGAHDITFVPYVPYPGSELYEELRAKNVLPPMSFDYFNSLLIHSDMSKAHSYNPHFSSKMVTIIKLLFLGTFYISNFLFRPVRVYYLLRNTLTKTPQTRGEDGLMNLFSKILKTKSIKGTFYES